MTTPSKQHKHMIELLDTYYFVVLLVTYCFVAVLVTCCFVVVLVQLTKDGHASKATAHARVTAATMAVGHYGQDVLAKIGATSSTGNKCRNINNTISKLGFALRVPIKHVSIVSPSGIGFVKHPVLPVRSMANEIFNSYQEKLLAGKRVEEATGVFRRFWRIWRINNPGSKVFQLHDESRLGFCIPCKYHADEGTGARKHAVLQCSWGPVIPSNKSSWDRYFFWSCMAHEQYRKLNVGFECGNKVLDSLTEHFAEEALNLMRTGIETKHGTFYLCFISFEGDLPAQAKLYHCKKNWQCVPNPMCPWCDADGNHIPYSDTRSSATWRTTTGQGLPWTYEPPLASLTALGEADFLAKDIFHIVNLGIGRTFLASAVCFLVFSDHFSPHDNAHGQGVPVRLEVAYEDFKSFCAKILHETPHVKHWSRENLNWKSLKSMPESSFKASDTRLMLYWLLDYLGRPWNMTTDLQHMHDAACGVLSQIRQSCYFCLVMRFLLCHVFVRQIDTIEASTDSCEFVQHRTEYS